MTSLKLSESDVFWKIRLLSPSLVAAMIQGQGILMFIFTFNKEKQRKFESKTLQSPKTIKTKAF